MNMQIYKDYFPQILTHKNAQNYAFRSYTFFYRCNYVVYHVYVNESLKLRCIGMQASMVALCIGFYIIYRSDGSTNQAALRYLLPFTYKYSMLICTIHH
jgi:hypothetical protein